MRERSSLRTSDGRTPLHRWIGNLEENPENDLLEDNIAKLRLFLEYSDGQELEALDGGGDTPLHTLIHNKEHPAFIREVIQANPMLLFRENAVGRTPAELAHDMFVKACVQAPLDNEFDGWHRCRYVADKLLLKTAEDFILGKGDGDDPLTFEHSGIQDDFSLIRQIHDLVNETASTRPGKRRLASLNEANDVALRIGESYQGQRYGWKEFKSRKTRKIRATQGPWHGELEDEDASSEKDQVEPVDFVSTTLPDLWGSAWERPFLV